eukprot:scaffold9776_cov126-Isochrysis_galbana.AAC.2
MIVAPRSSDSERRKASSAARAATSSALVASSRTMRGRGGSRARSSCTRRRWPLEQAARVAQASSASSTPSTPMSVSARLRAWSAPA